MPLNMGRGTDTRMYNPHSESSYMFRDNDEDQEKYGRGDSEFHEEKDNEKKTRRQLQNERLDKIRPFSLTDLDMSMAQEEETSDTGEEPDEPEFDARPSGNINDDTAGSRGHMLDVAVGARTGTGSAMGGIPTGPPGPVGNFGMIRRSDAEEAAWSELLKSKKKGKHEGVSTMGGVGLAGSARQRRKEHRKKWAQKKFKTSPGGRRPSTATSRRHKSRMRLLSPRHKAGTGQKGGLLESGLAAHMAHLGVKSKQPLRLESVPRYGQQMAQQQRRRLQGDVALPYSPHSAWGERSSTPGPTGSGRLQRLPGESRGMPHVRRPRLRRVTGFTPHTASTAPTAPRLPAAASMGLPSASSIAMSEPSEIEQIRSDILKARRITDEAHFAWMRNMLREIKEKIDKVKKTATKDTSGGGDDKPQHASNHTRRQTSRPKGATETSPDDDPRFWGAHPGDLVGQH